MAREIISTVSTICQICNNAFKCPFCSEISEDFDSSLIPAPVKLQSTSLPLTDSCQSLNFQIQAPGSKKKRNIKTKTAELLPLKSRLRVMNEISTDEDSFNVPMEMSEPLIEKPLADFLETISENLEGLAKVHNTRQRKTPISGAISNTKVGLNKVGTQKRKKKTLREEIAELKRSQVKTTKGLIRLTNFVIKHATKCESARKWTGRNKWFKDLSV